MNHGVLPAIGTIVASKVDHALVHVAVCQSTNVLGDEVFAEQPTLFVMACHTEALDDRTCGPVSERLSHAPFCCVVVERQRLTGLDRPKCQRSDFRVVDF